MIKFKRGDYLLLLLYADNQSGLVGRTRLQKIAFLFEKEILKQYDFDKEFGLSESMEFRPYHYGPFSKKVFDFIDLFQNLGLIEIRYEENPEKDLDMEIFKDDLFQEDDSEWAEEVLAESKEQFIPVYILSEKGKQYVEERLWKDLDEEKIAALDRLKRNFLESDLKLLIKYVYTNYPEFAVESKIKETILRETRWEF